MAADVTTEVGEQRVHLGVRGRYDLREVALMGFGHRDEKAWDGVMRLGFGLDGDLERQVGVELRQDEDGLNLRVVAAAGTPLTSEELVRVGHQVARVVSVDHDGAAFDRLCQGDPVLAPVQAVAPGFRPALFSSPYEAAVWSVLSARRARTQGIGLRQRLSEAYGATVTLAGVETAILPSPGQLLELEALPGLPTDRVPRLHAIAAAAQRGELDVDRLRGMEPAAAEQDLQRLPGIGPFYASLVVIRALGHADVLSLGESHSRAAVRDLYGLDHDPSDPELQNISEAWRPFRTWVAVMFRALGERVPGRS